MISLEVEGGIHPTVSHGFLVVVVVVVGNICIVNPETIVVSAASLSMLIEITRQKNRTKSIIQKELNKRKWNDYNVGTGSGIYRSLL